MCAQILKERRNKEEGMWITNRD